MINPDILLEKRIRQIRRRAKLIRDTWERQISESEEEYEEEYNNWR